MTGSADCPKCHGAGYLYDAEGSIVRCACVIKASFKEHFRPIFGLLRGPSKVQRIELKNLSQAIVAGDDNLAQLLYHVASNWGDSCKFNLRTIEELNAIGIRGTQEYRTLIDYIAAFQFFVIDWSDPNPFRGPGYVEMDEAVLVNFLKGIRTRPEKQVIVIIGPSAKEFKAKHRLLCETLAKMDVPYFDRGQYWRFAPMPKTVTEA